MGTVLRFEQYYRRWMFQTNRTIFVWEDGFKLFSGIEDNIFDNASCSVRNRRYLPLSKCFIKLRQSVLCMNNVFPISCGAAMFCQGGLIPSLGGNIAILVSEDQFAGYHFLAYRNIAPPIMYLVY